jgi:hypothetical protein
MYGANVPCVRLLKITGAAWENRGYYQPLSYLRRCLQARLRDVLRMKN